MQTKKNKYQNRMSLEDKEEILKLHSIGKTNINISKIIGCSDTAIRLFLKKNNLQSNIKTVDRSRPCKICGTMFTPNSYDGPKKAKYKTCSPECTGRAISLSKIKYTETDIQSVIELKKELLTNKEIVQRTNVDINKVKEIVKQHNLQLTAEQAQANAYTKKLEKNPKAMEKMRDGRITCPTNIFNQKIKEIKHQLEKSNNQYSIPYLSKQKELHDTSVRRTMHLRGLGGLIGQHHSSAEMEIIDFIKEYLPDLKIEQGNRKLIKPKEIDIFIPSLNLGIEYCGLYWHNELSPQPRNKNYHHNKMIQANKQGIRLITIFEDEWGNRQFQVKGFLKSVLHIHNKRIFARKCYIKEVDKEEARDFLEQYHIQGKTTLKVALGLYYNNDLVGLISGNIHHRQKGDSLSFVLNRLVFQDGVQVVGGASKLVKHLIKYARQQGYDKIISWSDNRWSEGNVYQKCNFTLEQELNPDYSYVTRNGIRQSKQSNTKSKLLKKGAIGSMENTESELAATLGYKRIWDCGKKRWIISLS